MDQRAREQAFITALVTEHFVLQSVRSATIGEANGRAAIYLSAVSSALVACGFLARATDEETAVVDEVAEQQEHDPIRVIDDLRLDDRGKPECWLWHLECYPCGQLLDGDWGGIPTLAERLERRLVPIRRRHVGRQRQAADCALLRHPRSVPGTR